ncbi:hypothetical protein PLICRDRAFT_369097 [Plicaturopsis crispa FD-325 SS-3]|uniref:Unplaced genomic scaffold PLICRscaffold_19, whole genome shotgun sequence n=1 Tax=Plicaturopsis crispa FD-325 SS-3 TaxID=944288 RepID=A0A0C9SX19_PLICR|nr:hypothetical protein PLICRDRAFT_369097 [Plicaturopsis crispa FD-325 SS-3]
MCTAYSTSTSMQGFPRQPIGIGHLPTELLSIIFQMAYRNLRETDTYCPQTTYWPYGENLRSPSLFPYSLSNVCRLWQGIMADNPAYWTRLVVLVGRDATHPRAFESQLTWSRGRPFTITVTRREHDDVDPPDLEREQVAAITAIFKPHIHRARTITFDVLYSGSLPTLHQDFEGTATHLTSLQLKSSMTRGLGGCDLDVATSIKPELQLECPKLQTLHLDGSNFRDAVRYKWLGLFSRATSVSISRFSPDDTMSLSLLQSLRALRAIRFLHSLEFRDVAFEMDSARADIVRYPSLLDLTFVRVAGELIQDVLLSIEHGFLESLTIIACPLVIHDPDILPGIFYLNLEALSADENPLVCLQLWGASSDGGHSLQIRDCPCFTDSVLTAMSRGGRHDEHWICPRLSELEIRDCHHFSGHALRRMVEAHWVASRKFSEMDPNLENGELQVSAIQSLTVTGCGEILSEEDQEWFKAHLLWFTYKV